MRHLQILLCMLCLMAPTLCYPSCTLGPALSASIGEGFQSSSDNLITCKRAPNDNQQAITAFLKENDSHIFVLTVLIVDIRSKEILAKFSDANAPYLSGIGDPTGITIDTGKYMISPKQRAVGVRVTYSLNPWDSTEALFLFLKEEHILKRIVNGLTVSFSTAHACYSSQMIGTIAISKHPTEGFNDLVVTTKETAIEGLLNNKGECDSSAPLTQTRTRNMHIKNGEYRD